MNKEDFINFVNSHNLFEHYDFEFINHMNEIVGYSNKYNLSYDIIPVYEIIKFINNSKYIIYLTNIGNNYICTEGIEIKNILKRELKIKNIFYNG